MTAVIEAEEDAIAFRPLAGALGMEVVGIDLSAPLDEATFQRIRRAFCDRIVLLFRRQTISPTDHVAFAARFGRVESHPLASRRGVEGFPEILVLENRPGRPGARNDFWHSDISFAERPPAASVLHGIVVPEGRGDTMFCNMVAAYETLSIGMRRMLDGMRALHGAEQLAARNNTGATDALPIANVPPLVAHPVVRTHPETGRKALYINPYFTVRFEDMTAEESKPLIEMLTAHAIKPENIYRHRWQAGDVLMWDNRAAMHYAVHDYDETMPRLMHRATAAGDRPY